MTFRSARNPPLCAVYCSGSIAKGPTDSAKLCWTDVERRELSLGASPVRAVFLNPDDPIVAPGDFLGQFGRDMYQVMIATAVVVDARERRGVGVGVEVAAANSMGVPVVVVAPPNTQYRRDVLEYRGAIVENYVHPHLAALAHSVVDDFFAAGDAVGTLAQQGRSRAEPPSWLREAIQHYEQALLPCDAPMLHAVAQLS